MGSTRRMLYAFKGILTRLSSELSMGTPILRNKLTLLA